MLAKVPRFCLFSIAHVIALVLWQSAMAGDPSHEQCSCTYPAKNGAAVTNATSCWLTTDTQIQWCDIAVQTLEDPTASTSQTVGMLFDNVDDVDALTKIFEEQFYRFVGTADRITGALLDVNEAKDIVPKQLQKNRDKIVECVSAFRDASFGKPGKKLDGDNEFRCGVGETSGWLRIEFRVGDVWLAYALSPGKKAQ
ncbi:MULTISPECIES: hypothetical protein [unclassified Mesorhizobium]|uniref:hypothetical protein n=1 Tax=unclassified Mesorhizobium TaxID=325217 RepID=UPI000F762A73|nr:MULTISPECIES: hypothetical protein [unclassified Mesorhizobium]AZO55201.1 hypothetical protein EJ077_18415 [Mesorhizobium sp. M8A.F.Ca.ET.057.01.1.1]RWE47323.1 MAG: hypothetical protein EOS80_11690 [Mesorhizobium sp.]